MEIGWSLQESLMDEDEINNDKVNEMIRELKSLPKEETSSHKE